MSPPNQGFKYKASLTAAASDNTGLLVAACGASRGGGFQLSGTFTGTVVFEQTLDNGTTWIAKTAYPAGGGVGVTSATATGQWKFTVGGETQIRVRCSAFTSGPIVVDLALTAGADGKAAPASVSLIDPSKGTALAFGGDTYTPIVASGTASISSIPVILVAIMTGNPGTANAVVVYDNTAASGTKIGTTTVWTDRDRIYGPNGILCATGLTITASATCDLTVITRPV